MARQFIGGGEHHRPRHVGGPAPQLAIDEVGQPPEQHPHRHADRDIIDHADEVEFVAPGDPGHCHRHAHQPAVERHAAVPQPQQFPRDETIAREIGKGGRNARRAPGIKRRIAQPPADDDAQRAVEKQIVGVALRHRRPGLLEHLRGVPIGENHPDQVSQRVIAQRKEAEFDAGPEAEIGPVDRIGSAACGK